MISQWLQTIEEIAWVTGRSGKFSPDSRELRAVRRHLDKEFYEGFISGDRGRIIRGKDAALRSYGDEFLSGALPKQRVELPDPTDFEEGLYALHTFLRQVLVQQESTMKESAKLDLQQTGLDLAALLTLDLVSSQARSEFSVWITRDLESYRKFFVPKQKVLIQGLILPCLCEEFFGSSLTVRARAKPNRERDDGNIAGRFQSAMCQLWNLRSSEVEGNRREFNLFHRRILGKDWVHERIEDQCTEVFKFSDVIDGHGSLVDKVVATKKPTTIGRISIPYIFDEESFADLPSDDESLELFAVFSAVRAKT